MAISKKDLFLSYINHLRDKTNYKLIHSYILKTEYFSKDIIYYFYYYLTLILKLLTFNNFLKY